MGVRTYKPTTPSRRNMTGSDFADVTQGNNPERSLTSGKTRIGGRNNRGRITTRRRGGGHKRRYRLVDFKRYDKMGVPAKVVSIEYDPNRSCRIALLHYMDGEKRYILAPVGMKPGDSVMAGPEAEIAVGNALPLSAIPIGSTIHNVELKPGKGGQMARSAGTAIQLMAKEGHRAVLRMPSGEMRYVPVVCWATLGQVGNVEHANIKIGKAGRKRWMGCRPKVRGMAMNPVDHPHGGGEGRGKGNHPQSPWGQPAKGYRTRRNKRTQSDILRRRK